jgi:hypothetical protein
VISYLKLSGSNGSTELAACTARTISGGLGHANLPDCRLRAAPSFSNRTYQPRFENQSCICPLDIQVKWMSTWIPSEDAHADIARHTRSDDSSHPGHDGTAACVRYCKQAPACFGGRTKPQLGHYLSGTCPAGATRLDTWLLEQDGEEPRSKVLCHHEGGIEGTRRRDRALASDVRRG